PLPHQLVADTAADIRELHAGAFRKIPQLVLEGGGRAVVGRGDMVELDIVPGLFSQPIPTHLFPGLQCKDTGPVMGIRPVDLPVDILPGCSAKDAFGKRAHAGISRCARRISFRSIPGVMLHFCSECSLTRSRTRQIWASESSSPSDAITCSSAFLPVCFPRMKCRSLPTRSGGKYSYVAGSSRIAAMWMPLSCENASSPVTGLFFGSAMPEYFSTF